MKYICNMQSDCIKNNIACGTRRRHIRTFRISIIDITHISNSSHNWFSPRAHLSGLLRSATIERSSRTVSVRIKSARNSTYETSHFQPYLELLARRRVHHSVVVSRIFNMTATTMHNHFPTLRKFKDKGRAWIVAKTDVVAIKIERLMIMCNGYNNIQPVRLSRGVATMVPHTTLMQQDQAGQYQFRPCLGSRRKSRGARDTRCKFDSRI